MRKKILFTSLMLFLLTILGCNKSNLDSKETFSNLPNDNKSLTSYYTGEKITTDENSLPAFMIVIENSTNSRPQSGLSQADIIYETSAEGGIPRFIALFQSESPEIIGPVRSVRSYFLDLAKERNLPFAHCGGSEEALNEINTNSSLMSINEISNGDYFWRDNTRNAPHNLYTSSKNIRKFISYKSWNIKNNSFFKFDDKFFNSDNLTKALNVFIKVNRTYNTSYFYEDNLYTKYMDGEIAIDKNTNKPLTFSNIIIQKTSINLNKDNIHLDIQLIGSGYGYILSKGKILKVTWKKDNAYSNTILYDENGNEVPLSPGKTIWNIIDNESVIQVDDMIL